MQKSSDELRLWKERCLNKKWLSGHKDTGFTVHVFGCCVGDFLLHTVDMDECNHESGRDSPIPDWDQPSLCSSFPG